MTDEATPGPADRRAVTDTVFGFMAAQALAAAVRLGVADHLGAPGDERAGSAVAAATGSDPLATVRLLRALAAAGFATEPRPGVFALTPRGLLLRRDRPDSLAAFVAMFLDPTMTAAWARLDEGIRDGATTFDREFGTDFFSHLATRPELSATFNASMRQGTQHTASVLPAAVDFARTSAVTDVGGGDGTLLAAVLAAHPHLHGVLFDTAAGSAEAGAVIAPVADRCSVVTGDFFAAVPGGSDAYLLKSVVHDWDDERVVTVLRHVRAVIPDHGRLLLVEPVLPETVDGSLPPTMYLSDLNMLVNVGGRERTASEFRAVCARAGFTVSAVTPLPAPSVFSVVEAVPE